MSGNNDFVLVNERGWRRGFGNMLRSELSRWWGTRMWWIQCLIWGGMIGFVVGAILFSGETVSEEEVLMIFSIFIGLFPSVAVAIIMQDVLVGEKREGTAAWVLSKPLTRPAFILSKVLANSLGVLVTMVIVPAAITFFLFWIAEKTTFDLAGFLPALGVFFANHFFFLTLTLMMGAFFNARGPVIGLPLAVLFLQQNLIGFVPFLGYILPWNLVVPLNGNESSSLAVSLILGQPVQSYNLLFVVLAESIIFLAIGLWRFNREEF